MKSSIKLLALAAALIAFNASAQQAVTLLDGGTNNIALSTLKSATNAGYVLGRFPGQKTAIQANFALNGAGTSLVTFVFEPSVDGSVFDVAPLFTLQGAAAGTATVGISTNIDIGGYNYLRIKTMQNTNATSVTNLVLKYTIKDN
jgi:hypothetical protein